MERQTPDKVLEELNKRLCENNDSGMFVTLSCGILDLATGEFSYANGGHPALILFGDGAHATFVPLPKGLVVGSVQGWRFPLARRQLAPGEALLVYSDGVTEAVNAAGDMLGTARLLEIVDQALRGSAGELATQVLREIQRFTGDAHQSDDITLLVLRYLGTER